MSSEDVRHRVFVYGTLKRGFCRDFALENETFLGPAQTAPKYRMVNLGTYPGLLKVDDGGRSIRGEVWEVSSATLERLDEIEGTSEGEYAREPIELLDAEFGKVEAYFYLIDTTGCPDCGDNWK